MKYLSRLKKLAKKSTYHQHQMSCLITKGNKIVSSGYNQNKTCPNSQHPFKHIHCEYDALRRLTIEDTKGCTVYVYRETKNGTLANAKPCESCLFLLQKMLISRIIYSSDNAWSEEQL